MKGWSCATALWVMLGFTAPLLASEPAPPQRMPDSYAKPGTLVALADGRQLNLRCMGSGQPTVLLEAGSHADSSTWFRVQPLLAAHGRVCAYDRAGFGFSAAGPLPRNLDADVADLHALIRRAKLGTPLVLVGHSLGTNIVRLYTQRYPTDVAGLVLVDPPAQDIAAVAPAWAAADVQMNTKRLEFVRQCGQAAEQGKLATPAPALSACVAASNPLASTAVNDAARANKLKPAFWHALLSELESNTVVFAKPVPASESLGAIPLRVLTAADTYADVPPSDRKALETARDRTQERIAASSTRGQRQQVAQSSHDVQLDQPEVVAKAVLQVAAEVAPTAH